MCLYKSQRSEMAKSKLLLCVAGHLPVPHVLCDAMVAPLWRHDGAVLASVLWNRGWRIVLGWVGCWLQRWERCVSVGLAPTKMWRSFCLTLYNTVLKICTTLITIQTIYFNHTSYLCVPYKSQTECGSISRLRGGQPWNRASIVDSGKKFFSCRKHADRICAYPGFGGYFPGDKVGSCSWPFTFI